MTSKYGFKWIKPAIHVLNIFLYNYDEEISMLYYSGTDYLSKFPFNCYDVLSERYANYTNNDNGMSKSIDNLMHHNLAWP